VCIVGGGPAGSFAALHLVHFARQQGLQLDIKVFEPRDFFKSGPGGCNRCAGILSTRLLRGLEWLGLSLPEEVIQANLRTYAVHLDGEVFRLEQPYPQRGIVSVYRGGGPRLLTGEPPASFDGYLLRQAINHGAQLVPNRVRKVVWEGQPIIHTANERFPADLMVLATGVNSRPPLAPHFGYRPPQTAVMAQDEVLRPPTWPADQVGVFFKQPVGLIFVGARVYQRLNRRFYRCAETGRCPPFATKSMWMYSTNLCKLRTWILRYSLGNRGRRNRDTPL
jgi:flavin-dependent dehydrogenase